MTHQEKIDWMAKWAAKNKVTLNLEGECGFGRECVGILAGDNYPDYHWYSNDYMTQLDKNGNVWTPPDAYHKHECVAVLGRGEGAEAQLFDWLKWFDENGFQVQTGFKEPDRNLGALAFMLGQHKFARMVAP